MDKLFFHKDLTKVKKYLDYIKVAGALVANSLINRELIGIDFSNTFYKVLFGIQLDIYDLEDTIYNKQEFENLISLNKMAQ